LIRLRVLALAAEADKPLLLNRMIRDLAKPGSEFAFEPLFQTRALVEEDVRLSTSSSVWIRGREEEFRLIEEACRQLPNILLFFVGPGARNSIEFSATLRHLVKWTQSSHFHHTKIISIQATSLDIGVLPWPRETVQIAAEWAEDPREAIVERDFAKTQDAFGVAIIQAAKALQREPEVGVGALLLSSSGRFLAAERLRTPGRGQLGTFGGSLPMLSSPESAVALQACRQFGIEKGLTIGPLLACTNMIFRSSSASVGNHYIDLTFLAFVNGEDAKPKDILRHKPVSVDGEPRIWFSLSDMANFYFENRLFAPVANAFHRYCSWATLIHITTTTSVSGWPSLSAEAALWMRNFQESEMRLMMRVASDRSRNQTSPSYYSND
jgi:hypothetical protein